MSSFSPPHRGTLTTEDGVELHTQTLVPEASLQAAVVLVHGFAEHCGRYGGVARAFAQEHVAVHAYDQRGYGRSGGPRAYVDRFDDYLDDLGQVLSFAQSRTPDRPLFLFGHSMGGLVALKYVLERAPSLQGLILSAPALEVNPNLAPVLRRLAQVLGHIAPTLPTTRTPEGAISRDPAVVTAAKNDPFNYHGRIPARTGAELLRAGREVRGQMDSLRVPFLLLHGTADRLVPPAGSRALYRRAAAADKTLHIYEGLYHETFHDPEKEQVQSDLATWVRDRLP